MGGPAHCGCGQREKDASSQYNKEEGLSLLLRQLVVLTKSNPEDIQDNQ
jgi:hypothetical protein